MKRSWSGMLFCAAMLALNTTVAGAGSAGNTKAGQPAPVTLYVMPQCGYCEKAREHLTRRGVSWQERDIVASVDAKREFDAKGGVGTPLIVIGDQVIKGFDATRLDATLDARAIAAD
ncbi:glutaredoxin family protein [Tahibacter caeni]|uniref:glutaredoxin family protein n=1 Tax=Tahibacter caeni TaxID=1453545 RepID=UPI0021493179|nr:glutaredoxin domain-containing protein [Tahibacter caeni]